MIFDFPERLTSLQGMAPGESIESVLSEAASDRFLLALDELIRAAHDSRTSLLGWLMPPRVAARFPVSGDPWMRIRSYCKRHFGDDMELMVSPHLVEALVALFQPDGSGVWIGPGALAEREPELNFDKEGLLVDGGGLQYTKEGILTQRHWLFYAGLPGVAMSGGFVEKLLEMAESLGGASSTLRVAVSRQVVVSREFHGDSFTRAYIRGPRGVSEAILQDPRFPPNPTGTVTEHAYDDLACLANKLFPVVKVEVNWSVPRAMIKEVEIEELVPADSIRLAPGAGISNRYVHAEWDVSVRRFTHFDGAHRIYPRSVYDARLQSDLRKFDRKKAAYGKAFKFEAALPLADWCDLTARYFAENELVLEYLGGPVPEDVAP